MPTAVTSLSASVAGVDRARACRPGRCRPPGRPARPGPARGAGRSAALEASTTASKGSSGSVVRASSAVREAEPAGERRATLGDGPAGAPRRPARAANIADQQADRPGPEHQQPGRPAASSAAPRRAQRVAARLDQRAEHARRRRPGSACSDAGRHGDLLGQRAGPAAADADLVPVLAHVLAARAAAAADAAAEHRVARDPPAEPGRVDAGADARRPCPHHSWPEPHRVRGVALVQVGHLAGEELDVGAAHADPLDVDDDLARGRHRRGRRPAPRPRRGR